MVAEKTSSQNKNLFPSLLVLLLIGAAFGMGYMWQRIQTLEADSSVKQVAGAQQPDAGEAVAQDVAPVTEDDFIRGDASAPITWIEYSDLECPFCAQIHPDLAKLMEEYPGKIKWVYRHFPLAQIHPSAEKLAVGAECAAEQGGDEAAWQYIDHVFAEVVKDPAQAAADLSLNATTFATCLESDEALSRVNEDLNSGMAAGVRGTPGNVVVGPDGEQTLIPGALPYAQLKATIDGML